MGHDVRAPGEARPRHEPAVTLIDHADVGIGQSGAAGGDAVGVLDRLHFDDAEPGRITNRGGRASKRGIVVLLLVVEQGVQHPAEKVLAGGAFGGDRVERRRVGFHGADRLAGDGEDGEPGPVDIAGAAHGIGDHPHVIARRDPIAGELGTIEVIGGLHPRPPSRLGAAGPRSGPAP